MGQGLKQMFAISQTVNWWINMYHVQDARGARMTPRTKSNPATALFFIFSVMICSFFIFNMFVGVVVSSYNRETERIGKKFLLTDS